MAITASVAAQKMVGFLTATGTGVNSAVAQLSIDTGVTLAPVPPTHIINQHVPVALAERAKGVKYPVMYVYADRIRNLLIEKFRAFSGKVRIVTEVRVSQDRLEGLEDQLRLYVDAVTQVLDANRGTWGQGAFYTGGYEVNFDPVQHGGQNFLQIAKVSLEVDFSE
jgi:hypothetical protein